LLEAPVVAVGGYLAANGGGGGGGGANENAGDAGANGGLMAIAMGGAPANTAASGRGGNGGFNLFPARMGASSSTSGNSGGGGGAVGTIFVRALGTPAISTPATPPAGLGTIVTQEECATACRARARPPAPIRPRGTSAGRARSRARGPARPRRSPARPASAARG
jgi:hypothetical protein